MLGLEVSGPGCRALVLSVSGLRLRVMEMLTYSPAQCLPFAREKVGRSGWKVCA